MDSEIQQRIIQKQATQIGNMGYQLTALESQCEFLQEKLAAAEGELSELRPVEAAGNTDNPA